MHRRAGYLILVALVLGSCGAAWGQKKAGNVMPVDGATDVALPALMWTAGSTAVFHTVYYGTTPELGSADIIAPRLPLALTTFYYQGALFEPGVTYYWRVDETEKDMKTVITGDVWHFTVQAMTSYLPDPADGSNVVPVNVNLKWMPGQDSLMHHVYLSTDKAAVSDGTAEADKGEVADPNLLVSDLLPATTYFWRVDEIGFDDMVLPGAVWSFTTILPVDDFESYSNDVTNRVFQTWIDGWGYSEPAPGDPGNGTGALVGYDPTVGDIMETRTVYGGLQSVPVEYNNVNAPFYSEMDRAWTSSQDWTLNGVDTLILHVQGPARDFDIAATSTAPVIDGKADGLWANVTTWPLTHAIVGSDQVSGAADMSGQFRVLYDSQYLYAIVDINDEKLWNDSSSAYLDDSVEFYVDGDNSKAPAPLQGHARQYTFGWTATDIQGTNTDTAGVVLAQANTATGWCLELKFPWQALIGAPTAPVGQAIGIDCFYNDDDNGADTREAQVSWHSLSGEDWQIAASWGTARIAAPVTAGGADALYVALKDASNHTAVVTYPDVGILDTTSFVEWQIPLADFTGVNLAAVRKMSIGVGDRDNPVKGGAGSLFFDDIYLTRPAPAKE
ncbi:MAG: hypothetical protein JW955_18955 [Sedimentisphaerales bacterium]|nr:hypothetical protein [Sedimentisphaerales bacterium]